VITWPATGQSFAARPAALDDNPSFQAGREFSWNTLFYRAACLLKFRSLIWLLRVQ